MNKKFILPSIIATLVIIVAVLAFVNKDNFEEKAELNNDAIFAVLENGVEIKTYTMEEIAQLGEATFKANLKSSGKDPVEYDYTGVLLQTIVADAGVSMENKTSAIVSAIDGYVVALSMDKLLDEDNVYLAYKRMDELIGTREAGGDGPYQMIISKDKFSQYWCKYAYSIDIQD